MKKHSKRTLVIADMHKDMPRRPLWEIQFDLMGSVLPKKQTLFAWVAEETADNEAFFASFTAAKRRAAKKAAAKNSPHSTG